MAYDVTAHTPAGWPYITDSDYLRVTPAYTRELANKLENSDADVAAAINAAAQAQAAAATLQSVTTVNGTLATPTLPDGTQMQISTISLTAGLWYVSGWAQAPDKTGSVIECMLIMGGSTIAQDTKKLDGFVTVHATTMINSTSAFSVGLDARIRGNTFALYTASLNAVRIR